MPHKYGPQARRFKFGVQYDCVYFGCAWLDYPNPVFTLFDHLHDEIVRRTAQVKVWEMPDFSPYHLPGIPQDMYTNALYGWIMAVDGMSEDGTT
jgi:hypothetical protein